MGGRWQKWRWVTFEASFRKISLLTHLQRHPVLLFGCASYSKQSHCWSRELGGYICIFVSTKLTRRMEQNNKECNSAVDGSFQAPIRTVIHFSPPLYRQCYNFIANLVDHHKPKKVADLGCGSAPLVQTLKRHSCTELLAGVDISKDKIGSQRRRLSPCFGDYLRPWDLTMSIILCHSSAVEIDSCLLVLT